jgi:uncharacterized protein
MIWALSGCATSNSSLRTPMDSGGAAEKGDVASDLFRKGLSARQNKDKVRALFYFLKVAELGNRDGMIFAASILRNSNELPDNLTRAYELDERAAALGDISSKYQVAVALLEGRGVPTNAKRGVETLQAIVADQRTPTSSDLAWVAMAEYDLSIRYWTGRDVQGDTERAFALCLASAMKNNPNAQHSLGAIYEKSSDYCDLRRAYVWYNIACAYKHSGEKWIADRERVSRILSSSELDAAQLEASELFAKIRTDAE